MKSTKTLGTAMFFGGLLIAFGAVGGMDTQPDVPLLVHLALAASGLVMMWVGTGLIQDQE